MTAQTTERAPRQWHTDPIAAHYGPAPVATGIKIFCGALVFLLASGYASDVPAATALCLGVAEATVDNTLGADGALSVTPARGVFAMVNSGAGVDQLAVGDIGKRVYAVDDQTVAKTSSGGTRCVAGTLVAIEGGWCFVEVGFAPQTGAEQVNVAQTFAVNDATNTGVTRPVTLAHTTSGAPGAGIGVGQLFQAEMDDGLENVGAVDFVATDESTGSADTDLVVSLRAANAALAEKLRLSSAGLLTVTSIVATLLRAPSGALSLRPAVAGGTVEITKADGTTKAIESDATGLGFFGHAPVAQQAAEAALTLSVAGDVGNAAAIATQLNIIENRLNAVSLVLRNLGFIAP